MSIRCPRIRVCVSVSYRVPFTVKVSPSATVAGAFIDRVVGVSTGGGGAGSERWIVFGPFWLVTVESTPVWAYIVTS